jgi:hypothetical protein
MKVIYLKIWPEYYRASKAGIKLFEIRKDDRPEGKYEVGDILIQQEYDPLTGYTGSEDLKHEVTYILKDSSFLPGGHVCMSLKEIKENTLFEKFKTMSIQEMATWLSVLSNHVDYEDGDYDPDIMKMLQSNLVERN